jgi:hypothetical protein
VVGTFTSSDNNYSGGTAQTTFTIGTAAPSLSVADAGGTYTGNAYNATGRAVGIDGKTPVSGSWSYAYYAGTNTSGTALSGAPSAAGTYTVVGTFTSSDTNYSSGGTAQATFTITPANPSLTVSDPSVRYTGNPYTASGSAVGVDGKTPVSGNWSFTYYVGSYTTGARLPGAPTTPGSYSVVGTFTSSDPNYNGGTATRAFAIAVAIPTLKVIDPSGPYTGNPFTASGSAVGVDGTTPVSGTWTFTYYAGTNTSGTPLASAPSMPGTYTVFGVFVSSNLDYSNGMSTLRLVISQLKPTLTVTDAGGTYTGNPFAATATAIGVDGKTPVSGSWTFTYYAGKSASGTPLAGPPSAAGTYTVLGSFTSNDPIYSSASATTTFTISKAQPTVTVTDAGGTYNGKAFPASGTAVGVDGKTAVSGSWTFTYYAGSTATGTPLAGPPSAVGTYTVVGAFTSTNANYGNASATTTFTVSPAAPKLSITDGGPYTSNPYAAKGTALGIDGVTAVSGSWTFTYYSGSTASGTPLSGPPTAKGTYTVVGAFLSNDPDYSNGQTQKTFTVS